MELWKCGRNTTVCETMCADLCSTAVYVQSPPNCQAMMATQVGKSSLLTQRTPCILRMMQKGTWSSWNNTCVFFYTIIFTRNSPEKKKLCLLSANVWISQISVSQFVFHVPLTLMPAVQTDCETSLTGLMWTRMLCWIMCCMLGPIPVRNTFYFSFITSDICSSWGLLTTMDFCTCGCLTFCTSGEHQMELLDFVAAKFHEEGGVFKLLVGKGR